MVAFHIACRANRRAPAFCDEDRRLLRVSRRRRVRHTEEIEAANQTAADLGCFNVQSGAQVANALQLLGAPLTARTKTGKLQVTEAVLRGLIETSDSTEVKDLCLAILTAKQCQKRLSSYVHGVQENIDADGVVHPSIKALGARTGRMSISEPPLQQLPHRDASDGEDTSDTLGSAAVRRIFVSSKPGWSRFSVDFDQIEMRIAAGFANERAIIDSCNAGISIHKTAAVAIFTEEYTPDQYMCIKRLNFGWLYSGGPTTLAKQAGVSLTMARSTIQEYERTCQRLTAFRNACTNSVIREALGDAYVTYEVLQARIRAAMYGSAERQHLMKLMDKLLYGKYGYVVTPFGRRLPVEAGHAYAATNYLVQSTARDVLAKALLRIMNHPKLQRYVLLPVHAEILGEAPNEIVHKVVKLFENLMCTTFRGVTLSASGSVYGASWGHGYGWKDEVT